MPGSLDRLRMLYGRYRALLAMSSVALITNVSYGVLNQSAIPPYVHAIHLTAYIGVIYAMFLVTETALKTPMGSLEDRVGMRIVYIVAVLIGAASSLMWTFMRALPMILVVRFVEGIASAGVWTATVVAVGSTVSSGSRTTAMGVYTVTYMAGLSVGPLLGGIANDSTGSKLASFYLAAALFGIAAVMAAFFVPVKPSQAAEAGRTPEQPVSMLREVWYAFKAVPDYVLVAGVAFFAIGLLVPIIKLFALQQLGMTETVYGLIVLPVVFVLAVASLASGKLAAFWGKDRSVHIGIALSAAAMYLVPLMHAQWEFGVLAGVIGLGFVIGMPAWLALISDMTAPEVRGTVIGALGTGQGVGVLIGVLLGGYLYSFVPFRLFGIDLNSHYTPFIVSALMLTVAFVLAVRLIHREAGRYVGLPPD